MVSWPFTRKTHWEDMDDVTWLDYVIRNVRRVRSNPLDDDEDDGKLVCDLALHGHFLVGMTANDLQELCERARKYESERLVWKGRKRKWRFRWELPSARRLLASVKNAVGNGSGRR